MYMLRRVNKIYIISPFREEKKRAFFPAEIMILPTNQLARFSFQMKYFEKSYTKTERKKRKKNQQQQMPEIFHRQLRKKKNK